MSLMSYEAIQIWKKRKGKKYVLKPSDPYSPLAFSDFFSMKQLGVPPEWGASVHHKVTPKVFHQASLIDNFATPIYLPVLRKALWE